jgi:peptide/nickel transport system substrate-binding protein
MMTHGSWGRFAALSLAVVLAWAPGCARKERARSGGTLVVGEINDYESLNPMGTTDAHARDIYNLMFLSLLDERSDLLTFGPRLAESWEFSSDRLRLTFHLRRDVVWTDGAPLTAADVEATFRAQKDPATAWASRHLKDRIDSVRAVDEWTVVYYFNAVYPYQLMDANDGVIMPKHVIETLPPEKIGALDVDRLPSSGPFRFQSWAKGQTLTLVKNERYYEEGKPHLDRVIFKIIPDPVTLVTQLKGGEIDCMEMVPPGEIDGIRKNYPDLVFYDFPTRAYNYVAWNGARPPFDNANVRRALTMAIDRRLINENIYYGFADECTSPFPPIIWAYDPDIEPLPFDTAAARAALAAEGFRDTDRDGWLDRGGKRLEFDLITNHGNQMRADMQVMIQQMLRRVGVKANPATLEWTVFLDRIKRGDYDAQINSWRVGTKADLAPIWACASRQGYNRVDYCNPLVDSLNAAATAMLDFERAKPLFHRAQRIIYDEQPYTFLNIVRARNVVHRRIKVVNPDAISMYHYLQDWWAADGKE